jgi:hypothetical protein
VGVGVGVGVGVAPASAGRVVVDTGGVGILVVGAAGRGQDHRAEQTQTNACAVMCEPPLSEAEARPTVSKLMRVRVTP